MKTEVYFLRLSDFDDLYVQAEYEKVSSHFISTDGERLSKRKESLMGRLLLSRTLEERGVGEFQVHYKNAEKPVLVCGEKLFFNISHSADFVALAVSDDEIGCDIQEIRPYNSKVAKRNYCENETKLIEDSEDKADVFIRMWALKESILKFTGKGLSGGLSTYDFSPYITKERFTAFGLDFYVKKLENCYFALCGKINAECKVQNAKLRGAELRLYPLEFE